MIYETPDNLIELLNGVVSAANKTVFYSQKLSAGRAFKSLREFDQMPVTPLLEYRAQRLADVVAEPSQIEWIVGPYKGKSGSSVAVAEGADEGAHRYSIFTDAIKERIPLREGRTCVIITSPPKRYFAAEIGAILIRSGISAHVFTDCGSQRTYERIKYVNPDILVVLSDPLNEADFPDSLDLCVTFRRSQRLRRFPQLDFFIIDELGFLGQSGDCETYRLNEDMYYFERSERGRLIVTSLYNHVQPMLRIAVMDKTGPLASHTLKLTELSVTA